MGRRGNQAGERKRDRGMEWNCYSGKVTDGESWKKDVFSMMVGHDEGGGIGGRRYSRISEASRELIKEFLFELMVDFPSNRLVAKLPAYPQQKSR